MTVAVLLVQAGIQSGGLGRHVRPVDEIDDPGRRRLLEADEDGDGARATGSAAAGPQYYIVQKGDTYGAIAVRGRDDGAALEQLNPGVSSNSLRSGRRQGQVGL